MDQIYRKKLLYKTGVEYGDYTANYVKGCSHGCVYPCYAFQMAKRFGNIKDYEEWIKPKMVSNTLELLDKELPKLKKNISFIHLCFTTDPFMYKYDEICKLSLQVIKKINSYSIPVEILTKGVYPKNLYLYSKNSNNIFGITLVSIRQEFSDLYEPNSSPIIDRLNSLKFCHNMGLKTWVSIEPYPTPNIINQDLDELLNEVSFVDYIVFGRWNYNKEISKYKDYKNFYNECAKKVIKFCEKNQIKYHIKDKTISK